MLVAAVLLLGALPQFLTAPLPDVSWLLYVARRMLDGARLYQDLVEVNPPLIVWLNLVPAFLAGRLDLPDVLVYRILVVAAALGSFLLSGRTLSRLPDSADPLANRVVLLLAAVALVPLAGVDFGEREHLLLILTLPYVLLVGARVQGAPVGNGLGWLAGLAAGIGIGLKPYFLLLPLTLETWLLLRRPKAVARPELLAIAIVAGAYLAAVQLWARPYWELARAFGLLYYRFLQEPLLLTALTGQGAGLALCALLAYLVLRDREGERPVRTALFLATLALYCSAVLQLKGWRYHFYPAMGTGLLLLGLLAMAPVRGLLQLAGRIYRAVALAAIVFVPLSLLVTAIGHLVRPASAPVIGDPDLPLLAEVVRREAPGGGLLVLSTNMASAFPLVPLTGARWASRFPSVWLLGALYQDRLASSEPLRYRTADAQPPLERYLVRAVGEDLARYRPDLLVVLRPGPDRWEWGTRRLDYVGYFVADSSLARELAGYGFLADVGEYRVYRRGHPGAPPGAAAQAAPPYGPADVMAIRPGVHVAPPGRGMLIQAVLFLALVALAFRRGSSEVPG